jgi:ERF superfamily protein
MSDDPGKITSGQQRELHALLRDHGISGDKAVHAYLDTWLAEQGLEAIESRADLPARTAAAVIRHLHESPPVTYAPGGLVAALVAIQKDLPTVAKTKTARVPMRAGGEYTYTYADLADVTAAALPLLTSHQIAWVCWPRQTANGAGYELVGELLHVNGESRQGALPLHGNDPQVLGGALTYYRRYLLGSMLGIVTDDDPDARATRGGAPATRQWDGPSTMELLAQMDTDAAAVGMTYEEVTASFRTAAGGIPVEDLDAMDPWELAPYAEKVHARAEAVRADQAREAAYDGPDTATLLATLESHRATHAPTTPWEEFSQKYRTARGEALAMPGPLPVEALATQPAWSVAEWEASVARFIRDSAAGAADQTPAP